VSTRDLTNPAPISMATPPSGEQFEIRSGDKSAVVVELGAGLRTYTVNGREVLDGYAVDEQCSSGRGQVLMPWPNRIQDGSYEFAGNSYQLPLSEAENHNAIHGLVRWVPWTVAERAEDRVALEFLLHPQPGYPFQLALRLEYALSEDGLRVTTTATNVGRDACPFGGGQHPYLTLGTKTVDTLVLRAPGRTVLQTDARGIPQSSEPVDGTEFDFRSPRPIGGTQLDNGYTDLERDADGIARVELEDPETGTGLVLWLDDSYPYIQLFTGDAAPSVRRRSLAIEPMTCPSNAFQTGEGLLALEPGESATGVWGISTNYGG